MVSPQVADGETAYNIKGKYENIEKAVATSDKRCSYSRELDEVLTTPQRKNISCYAILIQKVSDLD